jgi:hypothetical protein
LAQQQRLQRALIAVDIQDEMKPGQQLCQWFFPQQLHQQHLKVGDVGGQHRPRHSPPAPIHYDPVHAQQRWKFLKRDTRKSRSTAGSKRIISSPLRDPWCDGVVFFTVFLMVSLVSNNWEFLIHYFKRF